MITFSLGKGNLEEASFKPTKPLLGRPKWFSARENPVSKRFAKWTKDKLKSYL